MHNLPDSYLSPKAQFRRNAGKGGKAVYALRPFEKGELIGMWGGVVITRDQFKIFPKEHWRYIAQIEEDLYIASLNPGQADFINHSCEPNAGMSGQVGVVAMRYIAAGEEITLDYAMVDGSRYDEFVCECEVATCRGQVTGDDWRNPDLWARYDGYFSPYLQRRIDKILLEESLKELLRLRGTLP